MGNGILNLAFILKDWMNCEGERQRRGCSKSLTRSFAVRQYTFKSANDDEADVVPMEIEASVGAVGPASKNNYNDYVI